MESAQEEERGPGLHDQVTSWAPSADIRMILLPRRRLTMVNQVSRVLTCALVTQVEAYLETSSETSEDVALTHFPLIILSPLLTNSVASTSLHLIHDESSYPASSCFGTCQSCL